MKWRDLVAGLSDVDPRALTVPDAYADDPFNSQTLPPRTSPFQRYLHVHQQYALTPAGSLALRHKASRGTFGTCPRAACSTAAGVSPPLLPLTRDGRVLGYCPRCREAYVVSALTTLHPALYGESSAAYVEMEFPPAQPFQRTIFGFRIKDEHAPPPRAPPAKAAAAAEAHDSPSSVDA